MTGIVRSFVAWDGRAPRAEWWRVILAIGVLFVVLGVVGAVTGWTWPLLAVVFGQPW